MSWLTVLGIGEDGWDGLSPAARAVIQAADIIVGGDRHLALLPPGPGERHPWLSPFAANCPRLEGWRGRRVCVLASGEPLWFGVGATLLRWFAAEDVTVLPHPGAFSLAAARLGWAVQDCLCLTAHGRPLEAVVRHLHPGARLLILSENGTTPAALAALLTAQGWGTSRLTVLERLGGPAERRLDAVAADWPSATIDDLNTIAVELGRSGPWLPLVPGLPDDAFKHDGQLTKREVRAATLALLAPYPGALLWDIGAGCGSIAIEWMRAGGEAIAVERDPTRCAMIADNAARLGVPGLVVLQGEARAMLDEAGGAPDAVFLGGGVAGLLEAGWRALKPGGRLVANAVTVEAEAALLAWHGERGGSLTRLAVSRLAPTGRFHTWHPLMPVTQYAGVKE